MKYVLPFIFLTVAPVVPATTLKPGHFLKWNSDHTERAIRPVYPVTQKDAHRFKTYKVNVKAAKPSSVCFYAFLKPSNDSNFGAHCVRFSYSELGETRTFFNASGEQVANRDGVYIEKYLLKGDKYPRLLQFLNEDGKLTENSSGVAEFHFKRDGAGRRVSEVRLNLNKQVVHEHNGFYEARFAFDNNDYATYRKGFDRSGAIMEGPSGYATAYFWFDENGTFSKEEFRDLNDRLVLGPSGYFARIEYKDIDEYGNWHKIALFDEKEQLVSKYAAYAVAKYNQFNQRQSITYYDVNMNRAENNRGVAKYQYIYDAQQNFIKREGYSLANKLVSQ
ncbi:hypothetical protein [Pseudoalteromonas luteoviolacea]|uniref:Uncharacterized protein n=1 Tax=Pseudoalteromonas luteoviolacea S4060-1 TaxID=1365257 RepID=A0A167JMV6_9GAMM|nr:hypothetical protein [Pseudoalteromonas luteoviolacea]KZN61381.1 hypothetical protein N478_04755 [Pseudoalteromonas luteoviolacea S4060-1]